MLKRLSVLLLAVAVVCGSAVADAATKHKAKSHSINGSATIAMITTTGSPPVNGSSVDAGLVNNSQGAGAVRLTTTYAAPNFNASGTAFYVAGSLKVTLKGSGAPQPDGSLTFSGTGKVTGGTGSYKGAKGSFTFTGSAPGLGKPATFHLTGSAKY